MKKLVQNAIDQQGDLKEADTARVSGEVVSFFGGVGMAIAQGRGEAFVPKFEIPAPSEGASGSVSLSLSISSDIKTLTVTLKMVKAVGVDVGVFKAMLERGDVLLSHKFETGFGQ